MARTSEKIRVTGSIHVGAKEKNIKPTSDKSIFGKNAHAPPKKERTLLACAARL